METSPLRPANVLLVTSVRLFWLRDRRVSEDNTVWLNTLFGTYLIRFLAKLIDLLPHKPSNVLSSIDSILFPTSDRSSTSSPLKALAGSVSIRL